MARFSLSTLGKDVFAISLAAATFGHALFIFGVSFDYEPKKPEAATLEITLANFKTDKTPDEADFLAQTNQQGSGTLQEKAELTSATVSDKQDFQINDASQQQKRKKSTAEANQQQTITSTQSIYTGNTSNSAEQPNNTDGEDAEEQLSQQIASLEARLALQQQAYAKRPKVYRITSVSTKATEDAAYQLAWQQKVEHAGNKNYPVEARQQGLEGDVRLMVALLPNGAIHKIEVLESSGIALIDTAAIRSVHLASPFQPFPPQLSRKADVLEIIRTWQFRQDRFFSKG